MGVRLYTPTLGRFLTVDPIEGGSANNYEYARSNPINLLDLDGRECEELVSFSGGPGPVIAGQQGLRRAGIIQNSRAIVVNGRIRIPDQLRPRLIGEVKNVRYQSYTRQLRDYAQYARQRPGWKFVLYVRGGPKGTRTELSRPLRAAIGRGDVILRRF
jgi:uncharacterized protein RhaS with RHS repeats